MLLQLALFLGAIVAVWIAGVRLSNDTDVLAHRFGLGEAVGGLLVLAFVTNLPEVAITVSAALQHDLGIAVGNILGGIAIQTVVLAVLDAFGLRRTSSLTYRAASLVLMLEGVLVVAILLIVLMGAQLPRVHPFLRLEPAAVAIAVTWVIGLLLVGKARKGLPWHDDGHGAPGGQPERQHHARAKKSDAAEAAGRSTTMVSVSFVIGALVTLVGGIVLERSGSSLAGSLGMTGVLFGATVLAAATALPEVSTGLAAMQLDDVQMAVSDIFGGNAFLPVLFLVAGLVSGDAVLPLAQRTDLYLTALGGLLTVVYLAGFVFRPRRQVWWLGIDSAVVVLLYVVGIVGLVRIGN